MTLLRLVVVTLCVTACVASASNTRLCIHYVNGGQRERVKVALRGTPVALGTEFSERARFSA